MLAAAVAHGAGAGQGVAIERLIGHPLVMGNAAIGSNGLEATAQSRAGMKQTERRAIPIEVPGQGKSRVSVDDG